jgi:hypothetical protein
MNSEFHYYITGIIAHRAGFSMEDAATIAYATQLVDDNTVVYKIKDRNTGETYSNYISQTVNILKPKKTLMRIYSIFHFIPGDPMAESARRKDGKMHLLNVTPNSDLSQGVMYKAFKSSTEKRLYRIGIASHAYADTWAHQNFVGFSDSFNGFDFNPTPNIGHSDALLYPDKVNKDWTDDRLVKYGVKNNDRFIFAAKNLFYKYAEYLGSDALWEPLEKELLYIMEKSGRRLSLYSIISPWLPEYDKYYWLDKAIDQKIHGFRDFRNWFFSKITIFKDKYYWRRDVKKEDTDWYKFQEAVKDHQSEVLPLINNICKLMGTDIRSV